MRFSHILSKSAQRFSIPLGLPEQNSVQANCNFRNNSYRFIVKKKELKFNQDKY